MDKIKINERMSSEPPGGASRKNYSELMEGTRPAADARLHRAIVSTKESRDALPDGVDEAAAVSVKRIHPARRLDPENTRS